MRLALLFLLAATLTVASASATPVTLYAHVADPMLDFAMNTQEPPAGFGFDRGVGLNRGLGLTTSTLTCVPSLPVPPDTSTPYHTMYGYSAPASIDYETGEPGEPRVQPERGLAGDVRFDPAAPMTLHWSLSEPEVAEGATPVPVPNVVVQATMRASNAISVDDSAYDEGPVLAHGRSVPALLAGEMSQGVELDEVDGRTVYHFTVPMAVDAPAIPRATGFNLRVDVFVENEVCGDDEPVMPNSVLLHTSEGHRPRLELGVLDLLQLGYIHPQFVDDDLLVHTSVLDVWGVYDIVWFNATMEGPGLPATNLTQAIELLQPNEHRRYSAAAERAWILEDALDLPPGNYTVRITATTVQGVVGTWEAGFDLGQEQEMPSLPAAGLALALAVAALAARRR